MNSEKGKYISFGQYDFDEFDNLKEAVIAGGFSSAEDEEEGIDVVYCIAMGDDMPHGIIIMNDDVLSNTEIKSVLDRMEGYDEAYNTFSDGHEEWDDEYWDEDE